MADEGRAAKPVRGRRPLVHHGVELRCGWRFEDEARAQGHAAIAGLDEVGRGALCGPVVACAVVLGEGFDVDGIDDSKRLTCRQRERVARRVREASRACCVGAADHREIDRFNILRATYLAMERAVAGLAMGPDLVLVDALTVPGIPVAQRPIVKGDALSYSIAAASIVAKVHRDRWMTDAHKTWPQYGFAQHKGYSTPEHLEALARFGPCPLSLIHI